MTLQDFQNVTKQFKDKLAQLIQKFAANAQDLQQKYDQFIQIVENTVQGSRSKRKLEAASVLLATLSSLLGQYGIREQSIEDVLRNIQNKLQIDPQQLQQQNIDLQQLAKLTIQLSANKAAQQKLFKKGFNEEYLLSLAQKQQQTQNIFKTVFEAIEKSNVEMATAGLKAKATTGLVVDAFIEPMISFMEAARYANELTVGLQLKLELPQAKTEQEFVDTFEMIAQRLNVPYTVLIHPSFKQQLTKLYPHKDNLTPEIVLRTIFEHIQKSGDISVDETVEFQSQLANSIQISNALQFPAGDRLSIENIRKIYQEAWTRTARYAEQTTWNPQLLRPPVGEQEVTNLLKELEDAANDYSKELQQAFKIDQETANRFGSYLQFQKLMHEKEIDILNLMAKDVQKTVDKANKHVIISTLLFLATAQQDVLEQNAETQQIIRASLVNALVDSVGKVQQSEIRFEPVIRQLIEQKQKNRQLLKQIGFSEAFVAAIPDTLPAGQQQTDIAAIAEKLLQTGDYEQLAKFISYRIVTETQQVPGFQNLSKPLKNLVALDIINKYADLGKALESQQQVDLMRQMFAMHDVSLTVAKQIQAVYRDRTTRILPTIYEDLLKLQESGEMETVAKYHYSRKGLYTLFSSLLGEKGASQITKLVYATSTEQILEQYKDISGQLQKLGITLTDIVQQTQAQVEASEYEESVQLYKQMVQMLEEQPEEEYDYLELWQTAMANVFTGLEQFVQSKAYMDRVIDFAVLFETARRINSKEFDRFMLARQVLENNRFWQSYKNYMLSRTSYITNMETYRLARGMKGGRDELQNIVQSGKGIERIPYIGAFRRLRGTGINAIDTQRTLFPSFFKRYMYGNEFFEEQVESARKKLSEDITQDLEDLEDAAGELAKGSSTLLLSPGWYVAPEASKAGGGLIIFATYASFLNKRSAAYTYMPSRRIQEQIASKLFLRPEQAIQSLQQDVGQYQPRIQMRMYVPIDAQKWPELFELPLGPYQGQHTELRYEISEKIRKHIVNTQILNFPSSLANVRGASALQKFDIQRQILLSQNRLDTLNPRLHFMLYNVLSNREMATLLQRSAANVQGVNIENFDIVKFALARFGFMPQDPNSAIYQTVTPLTQAEFDKFKELFGIQGQNIEQRHVQQQLNQMFTDMMNTLEQVRAQSQTQYSNYLQQGVALTVDITKIPDYLLLPYRFTIENVPMQFVPHHLVDPISVSAQNDVGSAPQLKPFGFTQTPLQEFLNPVQQTTDAVRVVNRYFAKHPLINFLRLTRGQKPPELAHLSDHEYNRLVDIYEEMRQMQHQRLDMTLSEKETMEEWPGFYGVTVVLDKEQELADIQQALGIAPNTLAGDAYFASQEIFRTLTRLTIRNKYGQIELTELPPHMKVATAERQKGIIAAYFNNLYIYDQTTQQVLPVALIINDQGKRINKSAVFLQGYARLKSYLHGQSATIPRHNLQELQEYLFGQQGLEAGFKASEFTLVRKVGSQFVEIPNMPKVKAILQKVYFYTALSHEPKIQGASFAQPQTTIQAQSLLLQAISAGQLQSHTPQLAALVSQRNVLQLSGETALISQLYGQFEHMSYKRAQKITEKIQKQFNWLPVPTTYKYMSNVERLYALSSVYQRLYYKFGDEQFQNTARLVKALATSFEEAQITLRTGTTVRTVTRSMKELVELMGRPMAVISPGATIIPSLWDVMSQSQKKVVTQTLKQLGTSFEEISRGVKILRLTIPQLVQESEGTRYLALEGETLANFFQGQQSILFALRNGGNLKQSLQFYAGRSATLASMQWNILIRSIVKKVGIGIYGPHATARSDAGGIEIPAEIAVQFLKAQKEEGYLKLSKKQLKNLIPQQFLIGKSWDDIEPEEAGMFGKYQRGVTLVKYDPAKQKFIIQVSESYVSQRGKANPREVIRTLMQNLPFIKWEKPDEVEVLIMENKAHAQEVQERFVDLVKGLNTYSRMQKKYGVDEIRFRANVETRYLADIYRAETFGEMYAFVTRHPIAGHVPIARVVGFSYGGAVTVPRVISDAIAGDDDGDKINVLPYILLDPSLFQHKQADISRFGIFLPVYTRLLQDQRQSQAGTYGSAVIEELFNYFDIFQRRITDWRFLL